MKFVVPLRSLAFAGAALASGLAIAHATRSLETLGNSPVIDDAFYALSVSRHLALGHGLSVDGQVPTNGFQPLWVFLCGALSWIVGGDRVATLRATLGLSTLIWIAFSLAIAGLARRQAKAIGLDGGRAGTIAILLSLVSYRAFRHFHNGLETGLTLLLLAMALRSLQVERKDTRWALCTGLVFSLLVYARLDNVMFVLLYGGLHMVDGLRRRAWRWPPILACVLAGLSLVPWLARNLMLDGHLMPSSGRAESLHLDLNENLWATGKALLWWALPSSDFLPAWFPGHFIWNKLIVALMGVGVIGCLITVSRRGRFRATWLSLGSLTLLGHLAFLTIFYTFFFAAPWFQERYLSPLLVLAIPVLSVGLSDLRLGYQRFLPVALTGLVVANVVALGLSWRGKVVSSNTLYSLQKPYVEYHVDPGCVVGAGQSGTLGYFREKVVNLDGKVNPAALAALTHHRLVDYVVNESQVDVFVDWEYYSDTVAGHGPKRFDLFQSFGIFQAWVRQGKEACLKGRAAFRPDGINGLALLAP